MYSDYMRVWSLRCSTEDHIWFYFHCVYEKCGQFTEVELTNGSYPMSLW